MEDFFESSSPADYAKELINIKNPDENKETVAKIEDRISDLKEKIKKWVKQKKNKNADETLKIIEKILDYNKTVGKFFRLHQMLIKKIRIKIWRRYCKKSTFKKRKDCQNWKRRKTYKQLIV